MSKCFVVALFVPIVWDFGHGGIYDKVCVQRKHKIMRQMNNWWIIPQKFCYLVYSVYLCPRQWAIKQAGGFASGVHWQANQSRMRNWERSPNSRTPFLKLNISELPLNEKDEGNTLETRGLTYSYTFLTKPKRSPYGRFVSAKNAHLDCKGTKLFSHNQRVRLLFALLCINAA